MRGAGWKVGTTVLLVGLIAALIPGASAIAAASVSLDPCTDVAKARCGSITRLLDPQDPSLGTIQVAFELHRARDRSFPTLGTIVAVEGGPGYATTASRDYYLDLFDPLLDRRDLLLVDNRGTGGSGAINCKKLQSYVGDYIANVGLCGKKLGATSDVYGTAFAADDMAAVLDALDIDRVDMYGDSYGTFFGQSFALRHPDRLRTLTLDAAYPVEDQDPWYRDLNRALVDAFDSVCAQDQGCSAIPGDASGRLAALAAAMTAAPLEGDAWDADAVKHHVVVDGGMIAFLAASAAYGTTVYEELEGAGRAWLENEDPKPLLRIAAEQTYWGDAGDPVEFSEGLYIANICNDYPQLWDISSPIGSRQAQYETSLDSLRSNDPSAFYPFTIDDWVGSPWTEYRSCIEWPAPSDFVPAAPSPSSYPQVPTLVLVGSLDSLTSPEGAGIVASRFPNSTFVEVANTGHVTALADYDRCASNIVVSFVSTGVVGDTGCADDYQEVRTTEEFPTRLGEVDVPSGPGAMKTRRVSAAVLGTVGDIFPRWWAMYGYDGRGLRGGHFHTDGLALVDFDFHKLKWVKKLHVSGRMTWDRSDGEVWAKVTFGGKAKGKLTITWNEWDSQAQAQITGTIDKTPIDLVIDAP